MKRKGEIFSSIDKCIIQLHKWMLSSDREVIFNMKIRQQISQTHLLQHLVSLRSIFSAGSQNWLKLPGMSCIVGNTQILFQSWDHLQKTKYTALLTSLMLAANTFKTMNKMTLVNNSNYQKMDGYLQKSLRWGSFWNIVEMLLFATLYISDAISVPLICNYENCLRNKKGLSSYVNESFQKPLLF